MDSIKSYEVSQVKDVSKHETPVEKLVYLEQIDSLVPCKRLLKVRKCSSTT